MSGVLDSNESGVAVAELPMHRVAALLAVIDRTRVPGLPARLIAQGLRNREIAQELVISEKTVGNHVSNIFTKLQVADRVQAIIRAREAGLGQDKP